MISSDHYFADLGYGTHIRHNLHHSDIAESSQQLFAHKPWTLKLGPKQWNHLSPTNFVNLSGPFLTIYLGEKCPP